MRSLADVRRLLDELDRGPASTLEAQDLDFKRWDPRSMNDSLRLVVEMAVCMANGGAGPSCLASTIEQLGGHGRSSGSRPTWTRSA